MLKRFISYYKPYKKLLILDMIAALLISVTGMIYPIITRTMLNDYFPNGLYKEIVIAGCIVLALYIIRMFLRYFVQYYGHVIGVKMQSQMRKDLFAHLQKLPYSFYDNNETGRIMTRITSDLFEVCELAHHGPENLLISSVMIILSFTYLMTINWVLTLIVFAHKLRKIRGKQNSKRDRYDSYKCKLPTVPEHHCKGADKGKQA